ncbi:MAG TPA: phytanoyl-CoA dioxygenase family protein [Myxococcales bacterium]
MRLLPWSPARRAVGGALAGCIRTLGPRAGEEPPPPALASATRALRERGLAAIPPVFTPAELAQIRAYLDEQVLVGADGRRFRADEAPSGVGRGSYPLPAVVRCPLVLDLMNRPELLQAARRYLGCTPTISGLRIDWSAPTSAKPTHVESFHRDYDDWRFMKLFVYLTDVDEGSGPHEYVVGSHWGSGRFRARAYSDEEVERRYGRERQVRMLGPRGTSFLADTWGVHKGNVPTTRPRLLLQIQYSVLPVFKFAYRPVAVPQFERYDRYVNRLILAPGRSDPKSNPWESGRLRARG